MRCVAIRSLLRCVAIPVRQLQEAQGVLAVFRGSSDLRTPRAEPGLPRNQPGSLLYVSDGASRALGHDANAHSAGLENAEQHRRTEPCPTPPKGKVSLFWCARESPRPCGSRRALPLEQRFARDLGTLAPPGSPKHTPRDPLATCVEQWRSGFPEEDDSSTPWASSTTAQQHTPKGWAASTPRSPKGD